VKHLTRHAPAASTVSRVATGAIETTPAGLSGRGEAGSIVSAAAMTRPPGVSFSAAYRRTPHNPRISLNGSQSRLGKSSRPGSNRSLIVPARAS